MGILYGVLLIVGFFCLIKGADIFVDGSSNIAKYFHVPGIIIGLTIVACGTSAPELAVSSVAAIQGSNELALSNVVGSNLFNILMVLGTCSLFSILPISDSVKKRDFPISILASFIAVSAGTKIKSPFGGIVPEDYEITGIISRNTGITLLIIFILYMYTLLHEAKKKCKENKDEIMDNNIPPISKNILFIFLGLLMIVGGGELTVFCAKNIALMMGLSETIIGLTVVAVGTSLPELVTSVTAVRKGETGLAVGNAIGSNIFNMTLILGVSSVINPIVVNAQSANNLSVLICLSVLTWVFSSSGKAIKKGEGAFLIACYFLIMIFSFK